MTCEKLKPCWTHGAVPLGAPGRTADRGSTLPADSGVLACNHPIAFRQFFVHKRPRGWVDPDTSTNIVSRPPFVSLRHRFSEWGNHYSHSGAPCRKAHRTATTPRFLPPVIESATQA
jgi:hypothetical protein